LVEAARVDGVAYMHEQMGVEFAAEAPHVPALTLRFTKQAREGRSGDRRRR
jgi:hypothetical protein